MKIRLALVCFVVLIAQLVNQSFAACIGGVTTFPYQESFELGAGNWTTGGTASDWQLGTPAKTLINSAGDGLNCWITGGLAGSTYNPGERSWLQSPCFDFSTLQRPEIRFMIYWETEYQFDGGNLQYSLNGSTWITIGSAAVSNCIADNWYTINSITNLSGLASPSSGWSGTSLPTSGSCRGGNGSNGWVVSRYCLPDLAGESSVYFRFTFGSGTTCNDFDGLAIDKFEVYDLPGAVSTISTTCISSRTVLVTDDQPQCRSNRSWDFGDGTVETNSASTISHTYSSEGNYTITLTSDHTCRGSETAITSVTILGFSAEVNPVACVGGNDGSLVIQPLPQNIPGLSIVWNDPSLNGFTVAQLQSGFYALTLSAPSACTVTDTLFVPVNANADVRPELGPDRFFCPDDDIILTTTQQFSTYLWQNSDTSALIKPDREGLYWVLVTNDAGCEGSDTVLLELNCLQEPFFPSAFTPNDDLLNDAFTVFSGATKINGWYIFDRWGQVLFRSGSPDAIWDGKDVPEGVYTCLVNFSFNGENDKYKVGRVTLIR